MAKVMVPRVDMSCLSSAVLRAGFTAELISSFG